MVGLLLFLLLLIPQAALATTYTICASGCDYTSFTALFSGVNLEGDDIVEARADTPGGSKTFSETIAPGSDDGGSSGHILIIRARSGDTITIDAGGGTAGIYISEQVTSSYITFDGFNVINYAYAGIYLRGNSHTDPLLGMTVQNCTFTTDQTGKAEDWSTQGVFIWRSTDVLAYNNTVHVADKVMHWQTDCFYIQESSNVVIDGNLCWIQNQDGYGHNDGVQVTGGNGSIPYYSASNITIRNNILVHDSAHSDSKQLIYFEYEIGGSNYIYNNVAYVTVGSSSNLISVYNKNYGTQGDFYVLNNTFYSNGSGGITFHSDAYSPNIVFKNNIIYGEGTLIMAVENSAGNNGVDFRNNLYYTPNGSASGWLWGANWVGWDDWKALGPDAGTGADSSYFSNPLFVSVSAYPYDLSVGAASYARDKGTSLSGVFSTDIAGVTRPQNSLWDIGAYEYMTGADTTPPVLSSPLPSGAQTCTSDPLTVTIQVTTNEIATCKFDTSDVAYATMSNTFTYTGGTSHHQDGISLACDAAYVYYTRCMDASNNVNTSSTSVSFSIGAYSGAPSSGTIGMGSGGSIGLGSGGSITFN